MAARPPTSGRAAAPLGAVRPMSRAGAPPPTSYGFGAASGAAARPPTAQLFPPRTGQLRPVSRLATGVAGATGVALQSAVQISDRPITQHGIVGARATTSGPGRQVADKSYYLGLLRGKISELQTELGNLNKSAEQMQKDTTLFASLERKEETLRGEVTNLQSRLADYNMVMEHIRSNLEAAEVQTMTKELSDANKATEKQLEEVFARRAAKQDLLESVQIQIRELEARSSAQIEQLEPAMRSEFVQLQEENSNLALQISATRSQLENVDREVTDVEMELNQDSQRQRVSQLQAQLRQMTMQRDDLVEQLDRATAMDAESERTYLLGKIKEDNRVIEEVSRETTQLEEAVARATETLEQLDIDMQELSGGKGEKMQALMDRDREVTKFIDAFPDESAKRAAEASELRAQIVKALERISGLVKQQTAAAPTVEQFDALRSNTAFKQRQLDQAVKTNDRLQVELTERQDELDKINKLEAKIASELAALDVRTEQTRAEVARFADINALRDQATEAKKRLLIEKQQLIRRKDVLKLSVSALSGQLDQARTRLQQSDVSIELEALEEKMRHYEQALYTLFDDVESKRLESDFESLRRECMALLPDLNQHAVRLAVNPVQL